MSAADPRGGFEGSYLGDASRLAPDTRLECRICWHVYDPAQGAPHGDIPPGPPFAELPAHWTCPQCDGDRDQFLALPD